MQQLENDVEAGALDWLAEEALADREGGTLQAALKHQASPRFWRCYDALLKAVQEQADRADALLKEDCRHPSLLTERAWDSPLGRTIWFVLGVLLMRRWPQAPDHAHQSGR